jgi:multidrug resistance efflux pump
MTTKLALALIAAIALCAAILGWSKRPVEAHSREEASTRARSSAPLQEIKVRTEMNGRIREMRVEEGDRVKRGQVIAILENGDSTVQVAKTEAHLAEREQQIAHLSAPEDVRKAKAELEHARIQVAQARASLLKTFIRSPIDGRLLRRNVRPGEHVFADRPNSWIVSIQTGFNR